jgi:hypothetical protein
VRLGGRLIALLIGILALLAYAPSFTGEFQFDDFQFVGNPLFEDLTIRKFFAWSRVRVLPYATLLLNRWSGYRAVFDPTCSTNLA